MYTSIILLLVLILLTAGGWLQHSFPTRKIRLLAVAGCMALIAAACVPVIRDEQVSIYIAGDVLLLGLLVSQHTKHPIRMILLSVVCGLAGWKLTDWFPLLKEQGIVQILPALLLTESLSLEGGEKRLILGISPYVSALCVALMDQFLFRYTVLPIGTPQGFTGSVFALLIAFLLTELRPTIIRFLSSNKRNRTALQKEYFEN